MLSSSTRFDIHWLANLAYTSVKGEISVPSSHDVDILILPSRRIKLPSHVLTPFMLFPLEIDSHEFGIVVDANGLVPALDPVHSSVAGVRVGVVEEVELEVQKDVRVHGVDDGDLGFPGVDVACPGTEPEDELDGVYGGEVVEKDEDVVGEGLGELGTCIIIPWVVDYCFASLSSLIS